MRLIGDIEKVIQRSQELQRQHKEAIKVEDKELANKCVLIYETIYAPSLRPYRKIYKEADKIMTYFEKVSQP